MTLRSFIAALLTFWLVIGSVGTAWAAHSATPCDSMSGMNQPLPPADDCCGEEMDASSCLSACIAAAPIAVASAIQMLRLDASAAAIPGFSLWCATVLAPPDVAPPKTFAS